MRLTNGVRSPSTQQEGIPCHPSLPPNRARDRCARAARDAGARASDGGLPCAAGPAERVQAKLDAYDAANASTVVAETAFREQHAAAKDQALEDLVDGMKADLR